MSALIGELLQQLVSNKGSEKITKEEWDFFLNWKAKTMKSSIVGASVASGLVFAATRKLNTINRLSLAGGAGFVTGYWTVKESSKACVDQILGLDGSRMQLQLKKIVLQRYGDDPRRMQTFSKHFYGEEVYSDSNPEHPRLMYRQRHEFIDNPKVYGVSDADEQPQNFHLKSSDSSSNMEIKQVQINPRNSMYGYGDPLAGYAAASEAEQSDPSGHIAKTPGCTQKKVR